MQKLALYRFVCDLQNAPLQISLSTSMENQHNQKHIKAIYRMLLEMANGHFAYKISLDGNNKQFDEIAALLNEAAEKL